MDKRLIVKSPDILGGIAVFAGTRVPVKNLIDYLSDGSTIYDFLDDFPSVQQEQVLRFLEQVGSAAITSADENPN